MNYKIFSTLIYLFLAAFARAKLHLDDNRTVTFGIWDTAGCERYDNMSEVYCIGAHAFIVVFDITRESTFEKAKFWVKKLEKIASPDIFKALAGNKADYVSERMVTYQVILSL